MSEPHKVIESKDFSKMMPQDLTRQDIIDILGEMAVSRRFNLKLYEVVALGLAAKTLWEKS
jgi:hypothetical protein